jgi:hypothetical protein
MRWLIWLALLPALAAAQTPVASTMVTKTLTADPVTTWDDGTQLPAGIVVTYNLEHRYCGDTAWTVVAPGLTTPSTSRPLGPVCHEYAMVAVVANVPSVESNIVRIDLTPPKAPHAPANLRSQ